MRSRYLRLMWAAPLMAILAVSVAASGPAATDGPAIRAISGRTDGALSTVLIESSEPVAYLTSQPDPLTVFVDLRNARTEGVPAAVAVKEPPVNGVRLEPAVAPDGAPVARVRVALDRPAKHRVRSSRNLIYVEVERAATESAIVRSAAKDDYKFSSIVLGIVKSDAFRKQGPPAAPTETVVERTATQ